MFLLYHISSLLIALLSYLGMYKNCFIKSLNFSLQSQLKNILSIREMYSVLQVEISTLDAHCSVFIIIFKTENSKEKKDIGYQRSLQGLDKCEIA